jgi:hypothetical protein
LPPELHGHLARLSAWDRDQLCDDFLLVDASGRCLDADAALAEHETLARVAGATARDIVTVGRVAIVRGLSADDGHERKFTATWLSAGDTWRCAYVHETTANPEARNG